MVSGSLFVPPVFSDGTEPSYNEMTISLQNYGAGSFGIASNTFPFATGSDGVTVQVTATRMVSDETDELDWEW